MPRSPDTPPAHRARQIHGRAETHTVRRARRFRTALAFHETLPRHLHAPASPPHRNPQARALLRPSPSAAPDSTGRQRRQGWATYLSREHTAPTQSSGSTRCVQKQQWCAGRQAKANSAGAHNNELAARKTLAKTSRPPRRHYSFNSWFIGLRGVGLIPNDHTRQSRPSIPRFRFVPLRTAR